MSLPSFLFLRMIAARQTREDWKRPDRISVTPRQILRGLTATQDDVK